MILQKAFLYKSFIIKTLFESMPVPTRNVLWIEVVAILNAGRLSPLSHRSSVLIQTRYTAYTS